MIWTAPRVFAVTTRASLQYNYFNTRPLSPLSPLSCSTAIGAEVCPGTRIRANRSRVLTEKAIAAMRASEPEKENGHGRRNHS